jgi:hypothetical protein
MEEWRAVKESGGKWKRKSGVHKRATNAPLFPNPAALTLYSPPSCVVTSFCGLAARRLFGGCAVGCVIFEAAPTALFTSTMYEDEEGGGDGGGEAEERQRGGDAWTRAG